MEWIFPFGWIELQQVACYLDRRSGRAPDGVSLHVQPHMVVTMTHRSHSNTQRSIGLSRRFTKPCCFGELWTVWDVTMCQTLWRISLWLHLGQGIVGNLITTDKDHAHDLWLILQGGKCLQRPNCVLVAADFWGNIDPAVTLNKRGR